MAIFDKKPAEETKDEVKQEVASTGSLTTPKTHASINKVVLIQPRLSEKATSLASQHKYVFKVGIGANKLEVKKAVEKSYGVKVAGVNMIRMQGKARRYGQTSGRMSNFKKAVVTLTKESKGIDIVEAP